MRDEIFYLLLIACFILLVSSDLNREKLADKDYSICLSVDMPNGTEGVLPQVEFAFKNQFPSLKRFLFLSPHIFGDTYRIKQLITRTLLKSYQLKRMNLKAEKDKPFRLLFCLPFCKQDDHELV
jgi:hypothetical protein